MGDEEKAKPSSWSSCTPGCWVWALPLLASPDAAGRPAPVAAAAAAADTRRPTQRTPAEQARTRLDTALDAYFALLPIGTANDFVDTVLFLLNDPATVTRLYDLRVIAECSSKRSSVLAAMDAIIGGTGYGDPRAALVRSAQLLDLVYVKLEAARLAQSHPDTDLRVRLPTSR